MYCPPHPNLRIPELRNCNSLVIIKFEAIKAIIAANQTNRETMFITSLMRSDVWSFWHMKSTFLLITPNTTCAQCSVWFKVKKISWTTALHIKNWNMTTVALWCQSSYLSLSSTKDKEVAVEHSITECCTANKNHIDGMKYYQGYARSHVPTYSPFTTFFEALLLNIWVL